MAFQATRILRSAGAPPSWAKHMQKLWSPAGAYWNENDLTGKRNMYIAMAAGLIVYSMLGYYVHNNVEITYNGPEGECVLDELNIKKNEKHTATMFDKKL